MRTDTTRCKRCPCEVCDGHVTVVVPSIPDGRDDLVPVFPVAPSAMLGKKSSMSIAVEIPRIRPRPFRPSPYRFTFRQLDSLISLVHMFKSTELQQTMYFGFSFSGAGHRRSSLAPAARARGSPPGTRLLSQVKGPFAPERQSPSEGFRGVAPQTCGVPSPP